MGPFSPMMSPGLVEEKNRGGRVEITVPEFIAEMLNDGWNVWEIADTLQMDEKEVQKIIKRHNLKVKKNQR